MSEKKRISQQADGTIQTEEDFFEHPCGERLPQKVSITNPNQPKPIKCYTLTYHDQVPIPATKTVTEPIKDNEARGCRVSFFRYDENGVEQHKEQTDTLETAHEKWRLHTCFQPNTEIPIQSEQLIKNKLKRCKTHLLTHYNQQGLMHIEEKSFHQITGQEVKIRIEYANPPHANPAEKPQMQYLQRYEVYANGAKQSREFHFNPPGIVSLREIKNYSPQKEEPDSTDTSTFNNGQLTKQVTMGKLLNSGKLGRVTTTYEPFQDGYKKTTLLEKMNDQNQFQPIGKEHIQHIKALPGLAPCEQSIAQESQTKLWPPGRR